MINEGLLKVMRFQKFEKGLSKQQLRECFIFSKLDKDTFELMYSLLAKEKIKKDQKEKRKEEKSKFKTINVKIPIETYNKIVNWGDYRFIKRRNAKIYAVYLIKEYFKLYEREEVD
jgi:hypothetical protein